MRDITENEVRMREQKWEKQVQSAMERSLAPLVSKMLAILQKYENEKILQIDRMTDDGCPN